MQDDECEYIKLSIVCAIAELSGDLCCLPNPAWNNISGLGLVR